MNYPNITILGTSHIAKESIHTIQKSIEKNKPDIIGLELDSNRFHALLNPTKHKIRLSDIRTVGIKGYLFARIGAWAEEKMGKSIGVNPGLEMKYAIELAHKYHIPIALIDQDITITLKRFSNTLTWKEKFHFLYDILFASKFKNSIASFDLNKVPPQHLIQKLITQLKTRYPNVYQVLIVERNQIMAQRLAHLTHKHPEKYILAIIGAGHKKEVINLLKKYHQHLNRIVTPKVL
ncbi:MAG: TraB/GumN family protein [Nanoarchaeota archaeon]